MSGPQQPFTQTAGNPMGQSLPVNPVQAVAPIPDTSSQTLGLEDEGDKPLETSSSGLRRVVEKTVDKLGRSRSLTNRSPSKRIFSLGRNRAKEPSGAIPIRLRLHPLVLISRQLQRMWRQRLHPGTAIYPMTLPLSTPPSLPPPSARR